jgi:hypothetical protein
MSAIMYIVYLDSILLKRYSKEYNILTETGFLSSQNLSYVNRCWNFLTIFRGWEPSRNRVVITAHQATWAGGIVSLESILGLLKSLKIRALIKICPIRDCNTFWEQ